MRQIVDELRLRIVQLDSPYLLDLSWMNGEPFIQLGGYSNHRSSPDAVELFEHVAAVALVPTDSSTFATTRTQVTRTMYAC
nr:Imm7 family immunity protein [Streptomyces sp. H51]